MESSCIFNCYQKPQCFHGFFYEAFHTYTLHIFLMAFDVAEAIFLFFECCICMSDAAWILPYYLLLEFFLSYCTSCFSCLIWSFNDSTLFCFVDVFDPHGTSPLLLLMFSDLSICVVSHLLGWILLSLDFLLLTVWLLLHFNMSEYRDFFVCLMLQVLADGFVGLCSSAYLSGY